ncbi:MAG: FixH family protein [Gammaproteobacteria bacterium]|nr:FixH family protein [Gammaproteobacteria bacterium]MCY4218516.1 FixH family protein [Gammaproteobacteria bacterium]MCY4276152.1 FixH family protein [Gammaproteobacteria bacterium]
MIEFSQNSPWRIPAVWLIVGIPAIAVIVGAIVLTLSIVSYDGLVVDDYYKQGMGINQSIERTARAKELGIEATIEFAENALVEIQIISKPEYAPPESLTVAFRHATRSGFDQTVSANRYNNTTYHLYLPALLPGKWNIEIAADGWRVNKTVKR